MKPPDQTQPSSNGDLLVYAAEDGQLAENSVVKNFYTTRYRIWSTRHTTYFRGTRMRQLYASEYEKCNSQRIRVSDVASGEFEKAIKKDPLLSKPKNSRSRA